MENHYFIDRKNNKIGPLKLSEIKENNVFTDDLVWSNQSEKWKKASEYEELKELLYIKPPKTNRENEIEKINKSFFQSILKKYIIFSLLLGLVSSGIAISSWNNGDVSMSRYKSYLPSTDHETMHGNQQSFLFRPFKAFGSTIYLSRSEQRNQIILFKNLIFSSFISCIPIFVIFGIISYSLKMNEIKNMKR